VVLAAAERPRRTPLPPRRWPWHSLRGWFDSDLAYSFVHSPLVIAAALVALALVLGAALAGWIAPQDPFDLASLQLLDASKPPFWLAGGEAHFPLGTDAQGRDILSAVLYGTRLSLLIGVAAVAAALLIGVGIGLVAGFGGRRVDAVLMRVADVQLSFPAILIALLIAGVARDLLPRDRHQAIALPVLVVAIALSGWPQYARTVRGSTLVEKKREYVLAARVIGVPSLSIMYRHVLPNVLGPVLVLATVHVATAIITEATLSFLGVGVPPTTPSLGTLIRVGNDYLFSGEWWMVVFPGAALLLLALSVNLLGDWLRDALNPRLR
jgi:peptide/nickel transport system permease protein